MSTNERMRYKLLRISKNIKANELAKALKVSPTLLSLFEKGDRNMSRVRQYVEFIEQY